SSRVAHRRLLAPQHRRRAHDRRARDFGLPRPARSVRRRDDDGGNGRVARHPRLSGNFSSLRCRDPETDCAGIEDCASQGGTMTTTAAPARILGRHVWSELMTTDTNAAEAFYKKVIGWTAEPSPNSPMPYTLFKRAGGADVGGLMTRPQGM